MKRHLLIITTLLLVGLSAHAQYFSVNYDKQTVAAMAAAFGTEGVAEGYYDEQVGAVLKHYNAAEVAAAGIFASKFLERRARMDLGLWSSSTENYYYRRIYNMVAHKIMPKIWTVAGMMLHSPQTALYWGSYLMKVCDDTKSLCMQFESVVTNSTLSFADIAFLEINQEIAAVLKLSEIGSVDWRQLLDDFGKVPGHFTLENLKGDIDNLYNMGVGLASAGAGNVMDAVLQQSRFNDLFSGKLTAAWDIVENYQSLFESLDRSVGGTLLGMVGGKENVAGLFSFGNYDLTAWMTDYMDGASGNYYTQRWYIYRRDAGSETLCDYAPPTDDNSILKGGEWVRFETTDAGFYPNASQREQVLVNSERYAGWSRSKVEQMNRAKDGNAYTFASYLSCYIISRKNKQTKKAYAYEIRVTKSWSHKETVYEDVFDSYSMDLNTFKGQMNARLSELNDNDEGYMYYLGSDGRNYYQATDAGRLKGCESVTISVTCSDGVTLGQGTTQYKCRTCGGALNAHSKECAMKTSVTEENLDLSELDDMQCEAESKVVAVNQNANTGGGKSVTVEYSREDGGKVQCTYMHLSTITAKVGDSVSAGDKLGVSGNTGTRTTGEHLHFGVANISADGSKRDIDPAAYLADIAQKGNINLQALNNGNDLLAKYKGDNSQPKENLSPDDWMKKLLSSEDSGVGMSGGDPIVSMAMTMFSSLMMLAVQIDNKSEQEQRAQISDMANARRIDLTSLVQGTKSCTLTVGENGKAVLQADNGSVQVSRELTSAEMSRLSATLGNDSLSDETKRMRVAGLVNNILLSQQVSQNYEQGMANAQGQNENIKR